MCRAKPCPHAGKMPDRELLEESPRWQKFLELNARPDMSLRKIAAAMDVAPKTVSRWRQRLRGGPADVPPKRPAEMWEQVALMIADECPVLEIQRTFNIRDNAIYVRFPDYRPGQQGYNALMRQSSLLFGYPHPPGTRGVRPMPQGPNR